MNDSAVGCRDPVRYTNHDCRVVPYKSRFIWKSQMPRQVIRWSVAKHNNPGSNPVIPQIPATTPDVMPMTDRILSSRCRLTVMIRGSTTASLEVLGASALPCDGCGPPKLAMGSDIIFTKIDHCQARGDAGQRVYGGLDWIGSIDRWIGKVEETAHGDSGCLFVVLIVCLSVSIHLTVLPTIR